MRITYKYCDRFAKYFGLILQPGRVYKVSNEKTDTTVECKTLYQVWEQLHVLSGRRELFLDDASELAEMFSTDVGCSGWEFKVDIPVYRDNSQYVVIDGEEGDYGRVFYLDSRLRLLAIKHIHGGGYEHMEWTAEGVKLLRPILLAKVRKFIDRLTDQ